VSKNPEAEKFCDEMGGFLKTHDHMFKKFNELSKKLV
jgi:hypothetical protein